MLVQLSTTTYYVQKCCEHISIGAYVLVQIIEGFGVSRVLHSKNQDFKAGDIVTGLTGWEEYSVIHNTAQLRKIQQDDDESVPIPLSYHVGLLGTYLFCLLRITYSFIFRLQILLCHMFFRT